MKSFIPLDNNVNKLVAFTPSLDPNWRRNQRIFTNPNQIEPIDLILDLRKEGWEIKGSYQNRGSNGKISSNMVKLEHPDITLTTGTRREAVSNLHLSTFLDSNMLINSNLGMERLVCTNGLISMQNEHTYQFNPRENGYDFEAKLQDYLSTLGIKTLDVIKEFERLKFKELTPLQIEELAKFGIRARFGNDDAVRIDDVLKVVRDEDKGPEVWNVFNRVQENLSKPNHIRNKNGNWITGIMNPLVDKKFNGDLFHKAKEMAYA